ncbi:MAG: acyl-CoA-binding protein [Deinococcales bacterium]|nr:acyl-CoA-binding protein [Chitinophagaceae bacterium]
MALQELFNQAIITSKTLSEKPDNDILLQLYSLYKQATEGDVIDEYSGGPFDFVAKFKHQAWEKLKGLSKDDAMQQYVSLVEKLKGN